MSPGPRGHYPPAECTPAVTADATAARSPEVVNGSAVTLGGLPAAAPATTNRTEPTTATYTSTADSTFTTAYDADGEPVTQTQPGGRHDHRDLRQRRRPDRAVRQRRRAADRQPDLRLRRRRRTDHRDHAARSGRRCHATNETFTYNDRGELLTASGSAGSSSFGYNADGLMTSRTDAAGTTSYGYDTADRLSTLADGITGTQLTYGYDVLDQVNQVKYGSGKTSGPSATTRCTG